MSDTGGDRVSEEEGIENLCVRRFTMLCLISQIQRNLSISLWSQKHNYRSVMTVFFHFI